MRLCGAYIQVRNAILSNIQQAAEEKLKKETPTCIRIYDEQGEAQFKALVSLLSFVCVGGCLLADVVCIPGAEGH